MPKTKRYETSDHVVAFIDILGSKKLMNNTDMLTTIHKVYNRTQRFYRKICSPKDIGLSIKIFSDNIIISIPIKQKSEKLSNFPASLKTINILCGILQTEFALSNVLVRGGITRGEYFFDNTMVWGKALLRAHYLESKIANYPRIIIDPEIIGSLKLLRLKKPENIFFIQDSDGICYVDYLQLQSKFMKNYKLSLLFLSNKLDVLMLEAEDDLKAIQKIIWHSGYINSKFTQGAHSIHENNER